MNQAETRAEYIDPALKYRNTRLAVIDAKAWREAISQHFGRYSKELDKLAPKSFKIRVDSYTSNQFDNPVVLSSGNKIFKPATW
jgi:hypothetical protein